MPIFDDVNGNETVGSARFANGQTLDTELRNVIEARLTEVSQEIREEVLQSLRKTIAADVRTLQAEIQNALAQAGLSVITPQIDSLADAFGSRGFGDAFSTAANVATRDLFRTGRLNARSIANAAAASFINSQNLFNVSRNQAAADAFRNLQLSQRNL